MKPNEFIKKITTMLGSLTTNISNHHDSDLNKRILIYDISLKLGIGDVVLDPRDGKMYMMSVAKDSGTDITFTDGVNAIVIYQDENRYKDIVPGTILNPGDLIHDIRSNISPYNISMYIGSKMTVGDTFDYASNDILPIVDQNIKNLINPKLGNKIPYIKENTDNSKVIDFTDFETLLPEKNPPPTLIGLKYWEGNVPPTANDNISVWYPGFGKVKDNIGVSGNAGSNVGSLPLLKETLVPADLTAYQRNRNKYYEFLGKELEKEKVDIICFYKGTKILADTEEKIDKLFTDDNLKIINGHMGARKFYLLMSDPKLKKFRTTKGIEFTEDTHIYLSENWAADFTGVASGNYGWKNNVSMIISDYLNGGYWSTAYSFEFGAPSTEELAKYNITETTHPRINRTYPPKGYSFYSSGRSDNIIKKLIKKELIRKGFVTLEEKAKIAAAASGGSGGTGTA